MIFQFSVLSRQLSVFGELANEGRFIRVAGLVFSPERGSDWRRVRLRVGRDGGAVSKPMSQRRDMGHPIPWPGKSISGFWMQRWR
jgi:hypothetical protein